MATERKNSMSTERENSMTTEQEPVENTTRRRYGLVLLVVVLLVSIGVGVAFATKSSSEDQDTLSKSNAGTTSEDEQDSISNAASSSEESQECNITMNNYITKNGQLFVQGTDGQDDIPFTLKGVNWSGMETPHGIPFGLWDNGDNGTTITEIVSFLADNKFNSVRLPISISHILNEKVPNIDFINIDNNPSIKADTYLNLLKTIVQALAVQNISVLISIHRLGEIRDVVAEGLWFNDAVPIDRVLQAYDTLTSELCSPDYWNILGLDLKNEPHDATWGDGKDTDWQAGATELGNRMLSGCSNWLAFIEGVRSQNNLDLGGQTFSVTDWWGSGLQAALEKPIVLSTSNKVVWAPHYYPPSVFPHDYFYASGTRDFDNSYNNFVELDDDTLRSRVTGTSNAAFGYLAGKQDSALVVGEFGGLYAKDAHPQKTTQRVVQYNMEMMKGNGFSGGYMWSLNPESGYEYNPADTAGQFTEGLFKDDWLEKNQELLSAMSLLDDMKDLKPLPLPPCE